MHRRRLMTAAYPRRRRGINVGVETVTRAAAGCLGSTEKQNDKTVDAAGPVDAQTAPTGPCKTLDGFPERRPPSLSALMKTRNGPRLRARARSVTIFVPTAEASWFILDIGPYGCLNNNAFD